MSTILEPGQIEAAATTPPFLYLPPANIFALRAARLDALAEGNALGDYLRLIAGLCRTQQSLLDQPPVAAPAQTERQRLCVEHGLPPLAADSLVREGHWLAYLDALLQRYQSPGSAELNAALSTLGASSAEQRKLWGIALLTGQFSTVPAALVPFLGAALQAAWSHWLLNLPSTGLKGGDSLCQCPACGSPPMAGVIRHRGKYNGLRYLVCSLCACEWHVVRVKCVYCEQTKGLTYFNLEDDRHAPGKEPLRAECCPGCKSYLKQVYLECAPDAEALSADLASLALDLRLDQEGYQRLAPNLMLAPGGE
ncbi:formate dehydrogenase accessory protein FdhE [Pseudomonas sp.]|uniref:formate dehydrogenase accessory protein FdhE n=1 Tax=Pseudomonas sp. TaxID=306 RepID=UPI002FC7F557